LKSSIQEEEEEEEEEESLFEVKNKLLKCHIWLIALYGAENWTLWTVVQIYVESFEM
jgi:hypothetical protein